jgi:hypothetical protein
MAYELLVHLRDTRDGTTAVFRTTDQEDPKSEEGRRGIEFMWSEGNYACDCNRGLFLSFALGRDKDEFEVPCGHGTIAVDKIVDPRDGEVIYADGPSPPYAPSQISEPDICPLHIHALPCPLCERMASDMERAIFRVG